MSSLRSHGAAFERGSQGRRGGGGGVETNCFECSPNRMLSAAVVASSSVSFQTNDRTEEKGRRPFVVALLLHLSEKNTTREKGGPGFERFFWVGLPVTQ